MPGLGSGESLGGGVGAASEVGDGIAETLTWFPTPVSFWNASPDRMRRVSPGLSGDDMIRNTPGSVPGVTWIRNERGITNLWMRLDRQ